MEIFYTFYCTKSSIFSVYFLLSKFGLATFQNHMWLVATILDSSALKDGKYNKISAYSAYLHGYI